MHVIHVFVSPVAMLPQFTIYHSCDETEVPEGPQLLTAGLFAQNIKVTTLQNILFEGCLLKLGLPLSCSLQMVTNISVELTAIFSPKKETVCSSETPVPTCQTNTVQ
jgi:hypothetical protein